MAERASGAGARRLCWAVMAALMLLILARIPFAGTHIDLARDVFVAQRLLAGDSFPWTGPILAGAIHLGPVWYYLLAALLAISGSWLGTIGGVYVLAALQVPLAYLAGKAACNRSAGLLWACGLAIPSWSTYELLLPLHYLLSAPLALAFVVAALRCARRPRTKYLVAMGLAFVLALHAHPANLGLAWIALGVVVYAVRQRLYPARVWVLTGAIACLPLLPYVAWDASQGFADLRSGLAYVGNGEQTGHLAAAWPVLGEVAWGGTRYWLAEVLTWPAPIRALTALLLGLSLVGSAWGYVIAWRHVSSRRSVLLALAGGLGMLFTLAVLRRMTPYYMTTPLRVELVGLWAIGLARLGPHRIARSARVACAALSLVLAAAVLMGSARLQSEGRFPFAVLPVFDVKASAPPPSPFLLLPASAMAASGRFLCETPGLHVHGTYALRLVHDYAIEQRLACDRGDVELTGADAAASHWVGLSRALMEPLGIEPQRTIGPLALLPAWPVAPASSVRAAEGPVYPPVKPSGMPRRTLHVDIPLRPGEHVAVTNLAFLLVAEPAVTATLQGRRIDPQAADATTRVYACAPCTGSGDTLQLAVETADANYLDIVRF